MSKERTTQILLVIVAILLLANLAQPLLKPVTAFAQDEEDHSEGVQMTGTGNNIWILKGNQLYYIKWEHQFESFRVYGPEELER